MTVCMFVCAHTCIYVCETSQNTQKKKENWAKYMSKQFTENEI